MQIMLEQVFHVPKSNVEIIRGGKSRDKMLSISGFEIDARDYRDGQGEQDIVDRMRMVLERAVVDGHGGRK